MISLRTMLFSALLAGILAAGGVACGSSDDSSPTSGSATSTSAWCEGIEKFDQTVDQSDLGARSQALDGLAHDAPDKIREDLTLVASAFKDMEFLDDDSDVDLKDKDDENEVDEALDRIGTFVKDTCGYELKST